MNVYRTAIDNFISLLVNSQRGESINMTMRLRTLREVINKIMWDPRERAEDYLIAFVSRGAPGDKEEVNLSFIVEVGHSGFLFEACGRRKFVPYHRIIEIRNVKGGTIWRSPRHGHLAD